MTLQDYNFNELALDLPDDISHDSERFKRMESQRTIDLEVIRSRGHTPSRIRRRSSMLAEPVVVCDEEHVLAGDIEPDATQKL